MKKTLLFAAITAGIALAAQGETTDDHVIYTSHVTYGNDGFANITTEHGPNNLITVQSPSFTCKDKDGNDVNYLGTTHTMSLNMGTAGESFTLSIAFPVNQSYGEFTISNISVALGLNNADGTTYPLASYTEDGSQTPTVAYTLRVLQGGVTQKEVSGTYQYHNSGANQYPFGENFGSGYDDPNEIKLSGPFVLEVEIKNPGYAQKDFYVSVDNVEISGNAPINYVPEPTTATLSLLALAGLAARRRRK